MDLSTLPTARRATSRATGSPRGAKAWPTSVTSGRGLNGKKSLGRWRLRSGVVVPVTLVLGGVLLLLGHEAGVGGEVVGRLGDHRQHGDAAAGLPTQRRHPQRAHGDDFHGAPGRGGAAGMAYSEAPEGETASFTVE